MFNASQTLCASCASERGITSCEGCRRKFCSACLQNHRQELSLQLDELTNQRNELSEVIEQHLSTEATHIHPCYTQVDQWEKQMQANIRRVASAAREEIRQSLLETRTNVRSEFNGVTTNLMQHQKTGDFVEDDINRIKQQLNRLNASVQSSTQDIRLDTSASERVNWDALVSIKRGHQNHHYAPAASASPTTPLQNSSMHVNGSGSPMYKPPSLPQPSYSRSSFSHPSPAASQYNARRASTSSNSHYSTGTYTCVCCKTSNPYNPNGENRCSVCRSPALL